MIIIFQDFTLCRDVVELPIISEMRLLHPHFCVKFESVPKKEKIKVPVIKSMLASHGRHI